MTSRISWFYSPGSIWIVVGTDTGENTGWSLCYTCQTSASPSGLKPEGEGLQKGLRGLCLPRCNLWSVAIRVQELVFLKCIMSVALLCCVVHVTEPLLPLSVQVPHLITSQHTYTQTHTHTHTHTHIHTYTLFLSQSASHIELTLAGFFYLWPFAHILPSSWNILFPTLNLVHSYHLSGLSPSCMSPS